MKTLKLKLTGIRPLLMHNGRLADPTDPHTKALKDQTKIKTKTDEVFETIAKLEWEGGLYWSEESGPFIPGDNIERCIQLGAQKNKDGKKVQAAVFCAEQEIPIQYDGPREVKKMWEDTRFRLTKGVGVNGNRVMRTRPMIPTGWAATVQLEYDETVIEERSLVSAAVQAGALVGIGDWRPKFGRFTVEIVENGK